MKNNQFVQEFELHTKYLKNFAFRLTKDKNLAEDLFQDMAFKAFRYQKNYTANTNIKAWLSMIMKNLFINSYRKKKKRNEVHYATTQEFHLNHPKSMTDNDGEMMMTMKELFEIIDALDDDYRIPFLMAYKGYKYGEIQDALNLPMGTIKSRIFQARKLLKAKITKAYNYAAA